MNTQTILRQAVLALLSPRLVVALERVYTLQVHRAIERVFSKAAFFKQRCNAPVCIVRDLGVNEFELRLGSQKDARANRLHIGTERIGAIACYLA